MEGDKMVGANDLMVAKEIGYLKKSSEDNSKQLDVLYDLLNKHMKSEEKDRSGINNKMTMMFGLIIVVLMKDTGASGMFGGVLKTFFPLIF